MSIKVVACANPFSTERTEYEFEPGQSYREILEQVRPGFDQFEAAVLLVDTPVPKDNWEECPPDNATLVVRILPGNGKNAGTDIGKGGLWTTIAGIALMFICPPVGMVIAGLGVVTMIAGAGIQYVSDMVARMKSGLTSGSTTPSIAGAQNQANPWGPIPFLLGKHLVVPPYGAGAYTQIGGADGADQYLYCLFVAGYGPMKLSQLKIGDGLLATNAADVRDGMIDTSTGSFSGSPQVEVAQSQRVMSLYPRCVTENQLSIKLSSAAGATDNIKLTPLSTTRIEVDVVFQGGLVSYDTSDGSATNRTVQLQPQFRLKGISSWTALTFNAGNSITRASPNLMRFTAGADVAAGQYEVQVVRVTADNTNSKIRDDVYWFAFRCFKAIDPVASSLQPNVVRIALCVKATNQLNGIINQFNFIGEAIYRAYNGGGSGSVYWTSQVTRNPASAFLQALQGPMNPRPAPDSMVDWPTLESVFNWAAAKGYECNTVVTNAQTLGDLLRKIAATVRGDLTLRDGLYSIVQDVAKTVPAQHFSPRNTNSFIGSKTFPDPLHAYRVAFINQDNGWAADEVIVYDTGYNADGSSGLTMATLFESVQLWGITSYAQAWSMGMYSLAARRLRPEIYTVKADIENIVVQRGDLVKFTHDVPLFGLRSGRITGMTLDGSNNVLSINCDEPMSAATGTTYGIRIRKQDGSSMQVTLGVMASGDYTVLTPVSAIPAASAPSIGDLFLFGIATQESVDCIVVGIEMGDELSATLHLVDAAPGVHTADSGTIPSWNSQITLPVNFDPNSVAAPPTIGPPGAPGPAGAPGPQGPGGLDYPAPSNNVDSLGFAFQANANGTIDLSITWHYAQGSYLTSGFLVMMKSGLTSPPAFTFGDTAYYYIPYTSGITTYSALLNGLAARSSGVGSLPIHYRFAVIAVQYAAQVMQPCATGFIEDPSWIDKTFAAQLSISATDFWNFDTGEARFSGVHRIGDNNAYLGYVPAGKSDPVMGVGPQLLVKGSGITIDGYRIRSSGGVGANVINQEGDELSWEDPVTGERKACLTIAGGILGGSPSLGQASVGYSFVNQYASGAGWGVSGATFKGARQIPGGFVCYFTDNSGNLWSKQMTITAFGANMFVSALGAGYTNTTQSPRGLMLDDTSLVMMIGNTSSLRPVTVDPTGAATVWPVITPNSGDNFIANQILCALPDGTIIIAGANNVYSWKAGTFGLACALDTSYGDTAITSACCSGFYIYYTCYSYSHDLAVYRGLAGGTFARLASITLGATCSTARLISANGLIYLWYTDTSRGNFYFWRKVNVSGYGIELSLAVGPVYVDDPVWINQGGLIFGYNGSSILTIDPSDGTYNSSPTGGYFGNWILESTEGHFMSWSDPTGPTAIWINSIVDLKIHDGMGFYLRGGGMISGISFGNTPYGSVPMGQLGGDLLYNAAAVKVAQQDDPTLTGTQIIASAYHHPSIVVRQKGAPAPTLTYWIRSADSYIVSLTDAGVVTAIISKAVTSHSMCCIGKYNNSGTLLSVYVLSGKLYERTAASDSLLNAATEVAILASETVTSGTIAVESSFLDGSALLMYVTVVGLRACARSAGGVWGTPVTIDPSGNASQVSLHAEYQLTDFIYVAAWKTSSSNVASVAIAASAAPTSFTTCMTNLAGLDDCTWPVYDYAAGILYFIKGTGSALYMKTFPWYSFVGGLDDMAVPPHQVGAAVGYASSMALWKQDGSVGALYQNSGPGSMKLYLQNASQYPQFISPAAGANYVANKPLAMGIGVTQLFYEGAYSLRPNVMAFGMPAPAKGGGNLANFPHLIFYTDAGRFLVWNNYASPPIPASKSTQSISYVELFAFKAPVSGNYLVQFYVNTNNASYNWKASVFCDEIPGADNAGVQTSATLISLLVLARYAGSALRIMGAVSNAAATCTIQNVKIFCNDIGAIG